MGNRYRKTSEEKINILNSMLNYWSLYIISRILNYLRFLATQKNYKNSIISAWHKFKKCITF